MMMMMRLQWSGVLLLSYSEDEGYCDCHTPRWQLWFQLTTIHLSNYHIILYLFFIMANTSDEDSMDGIVPPPSPFTTTSLVYSHPPKDAFPLSASFRTALRELVTAYESYEDSSSTTTNNKNSSTINNNIHQVVYDSSNEQTICVYDKFPKARRHVLLLPRSNSPLFHIESIADLILPSEQYLDAIQQFHTEARRIAANVYTSLCQEDEQKDKKQQQQHTILCGYHAIPSLTTLHLHIISSDFDSDCIKNKKHINSFTNSQFFISPTVLEEHLRNVPSPTTTTTTTGTDGNMLQLWRVKINTNIASTILNTTPFTCFRCGVISKNVPLWKQHNCSCRAIFRSTDEEGISLHPTNTLLDWKEEETVNFQHAETSATTTTTSTHYTNHKKRKNEETISAHGTDIRNFFGAKQSGSDARVGGADDGKPKSTQEEEQSY